MRMAEPSMDAFTVAMSLSATLMATALFTRVSSVVFASSAIALVIVGSVTSSSTRTVCGWTLPNDSTVEMACFAMLVALAPWPFSPAITLKPLLLSFNATCASTGSCASMFSALSTTLPSASSGLICRATSCVIQNAYCCHHASPRWALMTSDAIASPSTSMPRSFSVNVADCPWYFARTAVLSTWSLIRSAISCSVLPVTEFPHSVVPGST